MTDLKSRIKINNIESIIKNDVLTLDIYIDINQISKYLKVFNEDFFDINIDSSKLLNLLCMINNNKNIENEIKILDYYIAKDDVIFDYFKSKNIFNILKIYNNIHKYKHVQKYLDIFLISYLSNLSLYEKIKIVLEYNLKFYIPILNNTIINKSKIKNHIINYYVNRLSYLIFNKKLDADNIIFDLNLRMKDKIICKYIKFYPNICNNRYLHSLKILLKNINVATQHLIININNNNKFCFDYIYEIHKNDIYKIFTKCKSNLIFYIWDFYYYEYFNRLNNNNILFNFIKKDVFKIDVLNYYINYEYFEIKPKFVIKYLINDDKISENIIKNIIIIKTRFNNMLFDLYTIFKNELSNNNSIKYKNIKLLVYEEYEIEKKNYMIDKKIVDEFLENRKYKFDDDIKLIMYINMYTFMDKLKYDIHKMDLMFLILSKKILLRNLNIKQFMIYQFKNLKFIDFINRLTYNINENFIKDIEESGLKYILNTDKTEENLHIFDKNIEFKTDYVSKSVGFILDEELLDDINNYINKIYIDIDFLFRLSLYSIRYNNHRLLNNVLNKCNKEYIKNYIINYTDSYNYSLINYAYNRKIINIIITFKKNL